MTIPQRVTAVGLCDKHGNPLYEHHIVERNKHRYIIRYEIGSFMLVRTHDDTDMYTEFDACWNDDVYPLSQLYWHNHDEDHIIHDIEIVGSQQPV